MISTHIYNIYKIVRPAQEAGLDNLQVALASDAHPDSKCWAKLPNYQANDSICIDAYVFMITNQTNFLFHMCAHVARISYRYRASRYVINDCK
ncbi:hypothetical protein TWF751_011192 [Orbilia oligospora]|nr:hypothetical protein TWF751_011192 [Orbilia oligospora]